MFGSISIIILTVLFRYKIAFFVRIQHFLELFIKSQFLYIAVSYVWGSVGHTSKLYHLFTYTKCIYQHTKFQRNLSERKSVDALMHTATGSKALICNLSILKCIKHSRLFHWNIIIYQKLLPYFSRLKVFLI